MHFISRRLLIPVVFCAFTMCAHGQDMVENSQDSIAGDQASNQLSLSANNQVTPSSEPGESANNYRQMNRMMLRRKLNNVAPATASSNLQSGYLHTMKGSQPGPNMNPGLEMQSSSSVTTKSTNPLSGQAPKIHIVGSAKNLSSFNGLDGNSASLGNHGGSTVFTTQTPMHMIHHPAQTSESSRLGSSSSRMLYGGRQKNGTGLMRNLSPRMRKKAAATMEKHHLIGPRSNY